MKNVGTAAVEMEIVRLQNIHTCTYANMYSMFLSVYFGFHVSHVLTSLLPSFVLIFLATFFLIFNLGCF